MSVLRTHTKICARGVVSASPSSSRPRVTSEESEGCELENSVDTTNALQGVSVVLVVTLFLSATTKIIAS